MLCLVVSSVLLLLLNLLLTAYDLKGLFGGSLCVKRLHSHAVVDHGLSCSYLASLRPLSLLLLHIVLCNVAQVHMGAHLFISLLA